MAQPETDRHGPYICEQCCLDTTDKNDGTFIGLQAVTVIELTPGGGAPTARRGCWRKGRPKIEPRGLFYDFDPQRLT